MPPVKISEVMIAEFVSDITWKFVLQSFERLCRWFWHAYQSVFARVWLVLLTIAVTPGNCHVKLYVACGIQVSQPCHVQIDMGLLRT